MPLRSLSTLLLCNFLHLLIGTHSAGADCGLGTIQLQTNSRDLIKEYDQLMDQYRSNQQVSVSNLNHYFYQGKGKQQRTCLTKADGQLLYQAAQSVFADESDNSQVKKFVKAIKDALDAAKSNQSISSSEPEGPTDDLKNELIIEKGLSERIQTLEGMLARRMDSADQKLNLLLGLVIVLGGVSIFLLRQQVAKNGDNKLTANESVKSETATREHHWPLPEEAAEEVSDSAVSRPSNSFKTLSQPVATETTVAQKTRARPASTRQPDDQKPASKTASDERQASNE